MSKGSDVMSKVWNMWRSPVKDTVFNYSKTFVRNYHSNSNGKEWLKPQTAIGVSEFKKLVLNSTVFVDKSLLIKDFLEDSGETLLMTFPRRWGKSINMDMIKKFLSIEVNQNGELLSREERENHKLFLGGEIDLGLAGGRTKLLNELKIAKHQGIILERQGQFPVVDIDFKNTKGDSYEEVLSRVKTVLHKSFSEHEYLSTSSKLRGDEIRLFSKYIDSLEHQNLTNSEVSGGLFTLSSLLSKHFGKKSYILMDEYDAAINHSYIKFSDEESKRVIELFRGINETTFKDNDYLEKGLITGVFRIAKANLFSTLNNLNEYNILDKRFFEYYGFTQQEVEYLLNQYEVPESLARDIKDWYNGYTLNGSQTYNPWSMVKCLTKFEEHRDIQDAHRLKTIILQNYWEESGNIDFIKDLFKVPSVKSKMDQLVKDEPLFFNLKKQISSSDFKILKEVMNLGSNYEINESVTDILFSYLFSAGYLTASGEKGFKLPNNEVRTEFQNKLLEYYKQQYNIDTKFFTDVTDQLQKILDSKGKIKTEEATESFKESFIKLLAKFPKFEKIKDENITDDITEKAFHGNEDLIHCVMSYITLQLKSISKFGTEIYLGKGIADIMLIDELNKKGAVIELKYNKDATVAVEQTKTKEYANRLTEKMDTVVIGLNVSEDKEVDIRCYEIPKGKNFSGNGANEGNNSYNLPYSDWFNKYYSEGIEKILQLRINDLEPELKEKIKILPAKYQLSAGNTDIDKMIEEITRLDTKEGDIVLVPYNVENKHWVDLIFKKSSEGFEVIYSDPENKPIEQILLVDLKRELEFAGQKLEFKQQVVEDQKYNNCGSEIIENFMYYLTSHRVSQEQAVLFHSQLIENDLYNTETRIVGDNLSTTEY